MNKLILVCGASAIVVPASLAASVMTIGGSHAESCYLAADSRDYSREALANCNFALSQEALLIPDRVATFVNRGIIHMQRSNPTMADADFDAALALDKEQPEAWLNKAILTVRYRRSADAAPLVEKALSLNTRRPALAHFVQGMIAEDSGNMRAAYDYYRKAQQLEPDWREPRRELARFTVSQR